MLAFLGDCDILFSVMRDRIELEEVFNTKSSVTESEQEVRPRSQCTNATNKRIGANNSEYLMWHQRGPISLP